MIEMNKRLSETEMQRFHAWSRNSTEGMRYVEEHGYYNAMDFYKQEYAQTGGRVNPGAFPTAPTTADPRIQGMTNVHPPARCAQLARTASEQGNHGLAKNVRKEHRSMMDTAGATCGFCGGTNVEIGIAY